ncbi:MAG: hypothetical protein M1825_000768 [Sarcosagium campestre]|nr:MAG: hypothetical protein M1825_000768 [Sarcosagium campestre]
MRLQAAALVSILSGFAVDDVVSSVVRRGIPDINYCGFCGGPFIKPQVLSIDGDADMGVGIPTYSVDKLTENMAEWLFDKEYLNMTDGVPRQPFPSPFRAARDQGSGSICIADMKPYPDGDVRRPNIPLHTQCVRIHDRLLSWLFDATGRAPSRADVRSKICRQYYKTIRARIYDEGDVYCINWEHGYDGACQFTGREWECEPGWEWIVADPIENIANLTTDVLALLEAAPAENLTDGPSKPMDIDASNARIYDDASLSGLPVELLEKIMSFLPLDAILQLHRSSKAMCERAATNQSFWRDALISAKALPWLWDLDSQECFAKDAEAKQLVGGKQWDWRKLVQDLRREGPRPTLKFEDRIPTMADWKAKHRAATTGPDEVSDCLPLGLRNRRRIWRLLMILANTSPKSSCGMKRRLESLTDRNR